jgi:hypothetical protein
VIGFFRAFIASMIFASAASHAHAQAPLTDEQRVLICRATAATLGYHPLDIVEGKMASESIASATYRRPSDGTRWTTHCKFDGDRVIWANVDSGKRMRWRDHSLDEKILWSLDEGKITITQVWGDGSSSTDSYNF